MLHTETVEPRTLSLLKDLMVLPSLQPFSLVVGTAMSLRYGHRSSVDFPHQPIAPIEVEDEIRMYSVADIAAMKIQAILGRAQKKDFWDLYELLRHYPLQQLMDWHKQKYPSQMLAISIPHAVTYFADAEESETPVSYKGQTWEQIKKEIKQLVSDYLR
jgi:hypothetical protein